MVYNAMKLFMEVNPVLFDECSHDYTESQNSADARKQERQDKWNKLAQLAQEKNEGQSLPKTILHTSQGIQGPSLSTSPTKLQVAEIRPTAPRDNADRLAGLSIASEIAAFEQPSPRVQEATSAGGA